MNQFLANIPIFFLQKLQKTARMFFLKVFSWYKLGIFAGNELSRWTRTPPNLLRHFAIFDFKLKCEPSLLDSSLFSPSF